MFPGEAGAQSRNGRIRGGRLSRDPISHLTLATLPAANADTRSDLQQFQAADIVVIGAPMYNFSVPTQLKAWIDRIVVAGETFGYDENGPRGLAGGKRVIIAVSSGNRYQPGDRGEGLDHVESYLRAIFGFIGIPPEIVRADGISLPDNRAAAIKHALEDVAALAA